MKLMLRLSFPWLAFLSAPLCLSQTPEALWQQKMLEELKSVRSAIERLENGQLALLALVRIQLEEQRLAALEAQRAQLAVREGQLSQELTAADAALRSMTNGQQLPELESVTGASERITTAGVSPAVTRHTEATQKLEQARRARQSLEESIAKLRARISALEKYLEGAAH